MRQWSFIGFEWMIHDLSRLRNVVEGLQETFEVSNQEVPPCPEGFEVLRETPLLGDGRFNLEVTQDSHTSEGLDAATKTLNLSVLVTSLMVDRGYETPASIMVAIKCQDDRVGERGARAGKWIWERWENDWLFREGSEVWECPLPTLSSLLENVKIAATDSLVLCVQIHSPTGPFIPQQPQSYYVPRELLEGLESLLDDANTGDVKFVCLQRLAPEGPRSPAPHSRQSSSSPTETLARKRVIWAHSNILSQRSEYFSTMLSSSFSESAGAHPEGRRIHTIVVEEADFETTYWLLKFCYANWLKFKDVDEPRAAIEGIGAGWNIKWLSSGPGEWEWKPFRSSSSEGALNTDSRSTTSGDGEGIRSPFSENPVSPSTNVTTTATRVPPQSNKMPSTARSVSGPSVPRRSQGSSSTGQDGRVKLVPLTTTQSSYSGVPHPLSPHSQRQIHVDPHAHPTPEPASASALAMYIVAHRYAMPNLATLALEHMMATISPQTGFTLLLASTVWVEIHSLIEDYVVEKWEQVSTTAEFEACCAEVAAGEWGPDGGKAMMKLFRRLQSPGVLGVVRA